MTKIIFGDPDGDKTKMLVELSKPELNKIKGILTGHKRAHLTQNGRASSEKCEACEEDFERIAPLECNIWGYEQLRGVHWREIIRFGTSVENLG